MKLDQRPSRSPQHTMFDDWAERDMSPVARAPQAAAEPDYAPVDPHIHAGDVRRVTGQNAAILARLREGPATNVELSAISLRYSARMFDLRAAGYDITGERLPGGIHVYTLNTD